MTMLFIQKMWIKSKNGGKFEKCLKSTKMFIRNVNKQCILPMMENVLRYKLPSIHLSFHNLFFILIHLLSLTLPWRFLSAYSSIDFLHFCFILSNPAQIPSAKAYETKTLPFFANIFTNPRFLYCFYFTNCYFSLKIKINLYSYTIIIFGHKILASLQH